MMLLIRSVVAECSAMLFSGNNGTKPRTLVGPDGNETVSTACEPCPTMTVSEPVPAFSRIALLGWQNGSLRLISLTTLMGDGISIDVPVTGLVLLGLGGLVYICWAFRTKLRSLLARCVVVRRSET